MTLYEIDWLAVKRRIEQWNQNPTRLSGFQGSHSETGSGFQGSQRETPKNAQNPEIEGSLSKTPGLFSGFQGSHSETLGFQGSHAETPKSQIQGSHRETPKSTQAPENTPSREGSDELLQIVQGSHRETHSPSDFDLNFKSPSEHTRGSLV